MDESVQKHLTPALDDARKLLLKAATLIDDRGLCQNGYFTDERGGLCIMGAIDVASGIYAGEGPWKDGPHDKAYDLMFAALSNVAAWNDTKGRTKDEVVAKLRAVALGGE